VFAKLAFKNSQFKKKKREFTGDFAVGRERSFFVVWSKKHGGSLIEVHL